MLIGSLLAEIGTGQVGDKCVAADLSSLLGVLIGRRNAEYAGNKKSIDVERPESAAANHRPEGDARNDSSKVPEMRLVLALLGVLICMVCCLRSGFTIDMCSLYFRAVFYGSVLQLKSTNTGQVLPWRPVSQRTALKW